MLSPGVAGCPTTAVSSRFVPADPGPRIRPCRQGLLLQGQKVRGRLPRGPQWSGCHSLWRRYRRAPAGGEGAHLHRTGVGRPEPGLGEEPALVAIRRQNQQRQCTPGGLGCTRQRSSRATSPTASRDRHPRRPKILRHAFRGDRVDAHPRSELEPTPLAQTRD